MDSLAQNRQTGKPSCHPLAPRGHVPQRCKTGKVKKKKQDCHPFCGSSSTTHPSLSVQLGLQTPQGLAPTAHSPRPAEEQSPNLWPPAMGAKKTIFGLSTILAGFRNINTETTWGAFWLISTDGRPSCRWSGEGWERHRARPGLPSLIFSSGQVENFKTQGSSAVAFHMKLPHPSRRFSSKVN